MSIFVQKVEPMEFEVSTKFFGRVRSRVELYFGPVYDHGVTPEVTGKPKVKRLAFFVLLEIYRSLSVSRHDRHPAFNTLQLFT